MKNLIRIDWLFCLWAFVFWAFIYPHHILFTEQLSLFLYNADFWKEYALQPGGWAACCGNFLAQFYINRWAGALIQTLLTLAMLAMSKEILKKAGGKDGLLLAGIFPALLLISLQCDIHFTPGDTLALLLPFALTLLYMSLASVPIRRLSYTLAMIPVYLFSGAVALCSLYLACMLYEWLFAKDKWRYGTSLWLVMAVVLPHGWQSVYLTPDGGLFKFSFPLVEGIKYIPWLLSAFIPVGIVAVKAVAKRPWLFGVKFSVVALFVVLGCGYYLFQKSFNPLNEQKFKMYRAASQSNWEKVLKTGKRIKTPEQHTIYFTNLALAMQGELPKKIFQYPQRDEHGLFLIRTWDDFNLHYGSEFYYHTGILNEAIRWIFDAYITRHKGMDYHTLIRLAIWNKENGDEEVAEKYFDILKSTLMYRSWAKCQQKAAIPPRETDAMPVKESYFIGYEPFENLMRYYRNNPHHRMLLDCLLCYSLLQNDVSNFLALFNIFYALSPKEIPQAYQEALLLIADMRKMDIRHYPIDEINEIRFRTFLDGMKKRDTAELKRQFGDTWWYYSWQKMKR